MELFLFLLFVVAVVPTLVVARREYDRETREMTPKEREEDRYHEQIW
jgi:hypothetical protein